MPSKQMFIDGKTGVACIVGYNNATNARLDPANNIDDVYLHSGLAYLQFRAAYGPGNVSFGGVARAYYTWDDGGKGGGCFITTACTEFMGLDDYCHELRALRKFRNDHMFTRFELALRVMWYYENAPRICGILRAKPDAKEIFERMYREYIVPSVQAYEAGDMDKAAEIYEQGVLYAAKKAEVQVG